MKDTDLPLPYRYAVNHRAGSTRFLVLCMGATGLLLLAKLLGSDIDWALVGLPAFVAGFRAMMFDVIRNATHEALRDAAADERLDNYLREGVVYAKTHGMGPDELVDTLSYCHPKGSDD